jgi:hypothetical protein
MLIRLTKAGRKAMRARIRAKNTRPKSLTRRKP